MDIQKVKDLANYMDQLRKIRTSNNEFSDNAEINQQLVVANMKIGDALFHMQKAFNIMMDDRP